MDSDFGHWFAGLVDGEGCFYMDGRVGKHSTGTRIPTCGFMLVLRLDDVRVLEDSQQFCGGHGSIKIRRKFPSTKNAKPAASWRVATKDGCLALVRIFDQFPLRSKKAQVYAVWREAVLAQAAYDHRRATNEARGLHRDALLHFHSKLRQLREFVEPVTEPLYEPVTA